MKEQTRSIWDYIVAHQDENITSQNIADALNLGKRSVDGSVTGFQRKGLTVREEAEILCADGTHQKVKYIRLTDAGKAFNPDDAQVTTKA